jgi:hypothetical protein
MIAFPAGARVWIAGGVTDMRCGMNSLALQVQQGLGRDPHGGEVFCFRGRKGNRSMAVALPLNPAHRSSRWSADRRKQKTRRMTLMFCPLPIEFVISRLRATRNQHKRRDANWAKRRPIDAVTPTANPARINLPVHLRSVCWGNRSGQKTLVQ